MKISREISTHDELRSLNDQRYPRFQVTFNHPKVSGGRIDHLSNLDVVRFRVYRFTLYCHFVVKDTEFDELFVEFDFHCELNLNTNSLTYEVEIVDADYYENWDQSLSYDNVINNLSVELI